MMNTMWFRGKDMYRLAQLALIVTTGCGRLGFDAADDDLGVPPPGDSDESTDERTEVGPCKATMPIADPVVAAGTVVEVPTFGSPTPEANVTIEVSSAPAGDPYLTTTSAEDGSYSFALASGGNPMHAFVTLRKSGKLTSVFVPDALDGDLIDVYSPITTSGAVGTLYFASGVSRRASAGTLLVMVRDCDGNPISDAVVTIQPPPSRMVYTNAAGSPDLGLDATSATGLVYALNAPAGRVSVTATKAGATFLTHDVVILEGDYVFGTRLRVVR